MTGVLSLQHAKYMLVQVRNECPMMHEKLLTTASENMRVGGQMRRNAGGMLVTTRDISKERRVRSAS